MSNQDDVFTVEQLEFLKNHHEAIVVGMIVMKFVGNRRIIENLLQSEAYQTLFSDFDWDSVLDYYEETSVYDRTLYKKLHEQFNHFDGWF